MLIGILSDTHDRVGPLVTALLSLKYGEGGWDRFDRNCLAASLVSVVVWWVARSPLLALLARTAVPLCRVWAQESA